MKTFDKNKWRGLSTSTISDALDKLGIPGQCIGIKPINREFEVIGPAYTVKYLPQNDEIGSVGDYIEDVPQGAVIALDNDGRLDATVWGDILTRYAQIRKIGGTVINGVCRDTMSSLELGYPLFSKGTYMRTGKDRVRFFKDKIPVCLGGVTVNPDDILIGDADGVVVIPFDMIEQVLGIALFIHKCEWGIIQAVEQEMNLKEARELFNYHTIQRKN